MTQLLNMVLKIMKYGSDCCHFVIGSLYEVYHSMTSWTRMTWASAGSNKYCHALIFISSLLVRSEAAWVHPEELNFKAIYYIYILNNLHKNILLQKYWYNTHAKSANGNICTFSEQPVSLEVWLGSPACTFSFTSVVESLHSFQGNLELNFTM